jgi:SAM-dependent methyltransferase
MNYDEHGHGYSIHRRPDPRIASRIHAALGDARTVVNVGAGSGSYEPADRYVLALEPSPVMRAQRSAVLAPAISAHAESLPLDDESVDAAMAILTVHHWTDRVAGLRQLRRVARGPVAVLTIDVALLPSYWLLADYVPEVIEIDSRRFPAVELITKTLGGTASVESIPIPSDCSDGFVEAYWGRPEAFLDDGIRSAQATWKGLPPGVESRAVSTLAADLASGRWDRRHGHLRGQSSYDAGLVLVVSRPARAVRDAQPLPASPTIRTPHQ